MHVLRPDPDRWRAARRQLRLQQAQERLDRALGPELERLRLGERIELALSVARNVTGFALRDCLELQTRYSLAPSYSERIREDATGLAERLAALLPRYEEALGACEALLAAPEAEWAQWSPPAPGSRPDDFGPGEPVAGGNPED